MAGGKWQVLPATCHLPPATCHLPPATCHLPPATCYLPPATCYLPPATCCSLSSVVMTAMTSMKARREGLRWRMAATAGPM
ncbi:MAG: hypothetical protein AB1791_20630, partial [Chloroflexota bacterium]